MPFAEVHHSSQTVLLVSYSPFYPEEMLELSLCFKRQPEGRIYTQSFGETLELLQRCITILTKDVYILYCKLRLKWLSPSYWKFLTYVTWIYNITRDKPKTSCNANIKNLSFTLTTELLAVIFTAPNTNHRIIYVGNDHGDQIQPLNQHCQVHH